MTDMFEKYDNMSEFYVPDNMHPRFPCDNTDETDKRLICTEKLQCSCLS